ncbi:MAG: diguanylate cyclase [Luteimonas sp.]
MNNPVTTTKPRGRTAKARSRSGLVVAALIFVAIGLGVVLGAQRLISDARAVSHTNEVISRLDSMEARLRDAESALRGYVLTGDIDYLADYHNARDQVPGMNAQIAGMVADNPAQLARAKALRLQVEIRMHQMANTDLRYESDGMAGVRASMDREVIGASSKVRSQKAQMVAYEREMLVQRAASTRSSAIALRVIALLGIPLGLIIIAAVYRLLVREIRRRADAEAATAEVHTRLRAGVTELEHKSADLRALSRYGSMLQSCMDADEALQLTRRMLSTLRPGTAGTLYRMRNSQDHAEAVLHWGQHRAASAETLMPESCWALRRGQPHLVADASAAQCAHVGPPDHAGVATACIPLSAQGVQLGLLYLSDDDDGFLSRVDIIEAVAEQLSMSLSNLSLRERLRLQSIREPLTGLFNRRYLEESATRELARCARRQLPLSLMMLDIDHFKSFNDVHGHAGGDALLAQFGKLLQANSRAEDIACRYGGEEFTLILPEAGIDVAMQRAEAIRSAVEAMRVSYLGNELPQVTVSIGVSAFPENGNDPDTLLRTADEALYRAKRNGRNRVEQA